MKFNKEIYWRNPEKWRRKWKEYYWDDPDRSRELDRRKYRRQKAIKHIERIRNKENENPQEPN